MTDAVIQEDVLHLAANICGRSDDPRLAAIAAGLQGTIDRHVDERLQSIGAKLLAEHGEGAERENLTLATLGGYLTGSVGR